MESIKRLRDELQICETCGARPTIAAMSAYADEIERELAERYVELPLDADGVPIHVGDVMAYEDNTKPTKVVALVPPAVILTDEGPRYADMCRHYQPDTWERIIEDACNIHGSGFNPCWDEARDALVARCKALAGEVSE